MTLKRDRYVYVWKPRGLHFRVAKKKKVTFSLMDSGLLRLLNRCMGKPRFVVRTAGTDYVYKPKELKGGSCVK